MKAIHNRILIISMKDYVVINHKPTKFESNSQPAGTRTKK
ncbi:hypothetical protein HMPREF9073_01311 [Capnocytophaga sp. oral taxon 326 str. F0382]|nr:hypothetical protein HMPREF9073_01311 [Capnocytophaga sp. oral taxon 326 str. F0382]